MTTKGRFDSHGKKLFVEAILRSALCGIAVGFAADFIAALALWFTPVNGLWICIGAFAVVGLIASVLFYFLKFRPSDINSARRLDSLGLKERLVTMVEYQEDESYMANLQRNDAKLALSKLDAKSLKIIIPRAIAVTLAVCTVLGAGMTTVNALSENGVLPGGDDLIDSVIEQQTTEYVSVSYIIEEGGIIEGDEEQIIVKGTDASTVTAVADEGYVFKEWSDGYVSPTRTDKEITEDITYVAIFVELGDGEGDGDGDGDGEGEEGDEPEDAPSDKQEGNDSGNQNNEGDPNGDSQNGGGNIMDPANQIINNSEYYRDIIEKLADETGERLENGDGSLSQEEIDIIKKYLGIV